MHEMNDMLSISRQVEHPYFYRFSYRLGKGILATRIRKNALQNSMKSRAFHSIDIDPNSSMGKAINRLERIQNSLVSKNAKR